MAIDDFARVRLVIGERPVVPAGDGGPMHTARVRQLCVTV